MRRFALLVALAPCLSCGEGEPSGPPPPPAGPSAPASVAVFPGALSLNALGRTGDLRAHVRDRSGRTLTDVPVTWSSSAPSVATVDSAGRVTAVDNGKAAIAASAGEASGEAAVTVLQQAASLALSPPDTVRAYGDSARVTARATDANGHPIPPTVLVWTSSDTRIVTVDSTGLVTAAGNGTASVSAWSGPFRVSVDVTVYDVAEARKTDREVLTTFFDNGRGHIWRSKENWGTEAPLSAWEGVSTDEDGRVTELSLPRNQVHGSIPPELVRLDRLEVLNLARNRITGAIPPELGKFERLRVLDLSANQILTPIPPELGNLASLRVLDLGGIDIEGPLPAEFFGLSGLEVLRLDNTRMREIPPELAQLSGLRVLDLGRNGEKLTGGIPPELGDLENLEVLRLNGNYLSGGIPPELGKLTRLDTLNLRDSGIGGAVPPELGNLTNLRSLRLGNPVGFPPPPIWRAPARVGYVWELVVTLAEKGARLEELSVENGTGGPIPPEIGKLTQLKTLSWVASGLPGPIPPEIGRLTNLSKLSLRANNLTGPIPPEIVKLVRLDTLSLVDNELTGPIPPELGNLRQFRTLALSRNRLTGPIPTELGNLSNLIELSLDGNRLTGRVPAELGNLDRLWALVLSDNPLHGPLPATLTRLKALDYLWFEGTNLCVPRSSSWDAWLLTVKSVRRRNMRCPSAPE